MVASNSSYPSAASTRRGAFVTRVSAGMFLALAVVAGAIVHGHSHSHGYGSYLLLPILSRWVSRNSQSKSNSGLLYVMRRLIQREHLQLSEQEYQIVEEEESELRVELLAELLVERDSSNRNCTAAAKEEKLLQRVEKFQVGDVVEQIYNGNTVKNRILYPFQVEKASVGPFDLQGASEDSDHDDIHVRYTLTRMVDGLQVEDIPESFLRHYSPYSQDSVSLCNLGKNSAGRERVVACTIVDYIPASKSLVARESEYRVKIRDGQEKELILPIGMLNRFA